MLQNDAFINDLKIQSQRDLDTSELLLERNGPIEHVAWFCEQSFEKTVKYVYAYFKLKIQGQNLDSVHDNMREKKHYHTDDLILNLSRELYRGYNEIVIKNNSILSNLPEELKKPMQDIIAQVPQNATGLFDSWFDQARDKIDTLLRAKNQYNESLKKSTREHLEAYLEKFNYDKKIENIVAGLTKDLSSQLGMSPFLGSNLYQNHVNFVLKVLALSPWILPYTEMSRYPLKECAYINLQVFRENESELRPYFSYLILVLKQLQKEADAYIDSIQSLSKL